MTAKLVLEDHLIWGSFASFLSTSELRDSYVSASSAVVLEFKLALAFERDHYRVQSPGLLNAS